MTQVNSPSGNYAVTFFRLLPRALMTLMVRLWFGGLRSGKRSGRCRCWSTPGSVGLATDALNALLDFGFGELRLERIALEVFDYNERAMASYRKAGFTEEVRRRRARFHRGEFHDVVVMAILRPDWLALARPRSWDLPALEGG